MQRCETHDYYVQNLWNAGNNKVCKTKFNIVLIPYKQQEKEVKWQEKVHECHNL